MPLHEVGLCQGDFVLDEDDDVITAVHHLPDKSSAPDVRAETSR